MLRIGICDDEPLFMNEFKKNMAQIFDRHQWKGEIAAFTSGAQLIKSNETTKFDMVFLDIDMPEADGFSVAKSIPGKDTLLVFCTSHNELVYHSFSYQPFWFLCKENYEKHLEEVLMAARQKIALRNTNYEFNINGEVYNVDIEEIIYIDVSKHRVYIHFRDGKEIHFRENLSNIEEIFRSYCFVRVNSGCLVNMRWIKHIYQTEVELKDGQIFTLSRGRKSEAKEKFHEYMRAYR
jgi:two-component system response regulator LytT